MHVCVHARDRQLTCLSIRPQADEAREQGIEEVLKLLQLPDDLSRLPGLRTDYQNKYKATKAGISSVIQSQVEAIRWGVDLLERSHECIVKLRSKLDNINA